MTAALMSPQELLGAAEEMWRDAEARGIRVALIGGLALNLMGSPRLTHDVDFVADAGAPERYPRDAERRTLSFGGDRVVGPGGVPTDWVVRSDEYAELYQAALDLAGPHRATLVPVAAPEYIAAMKMAAGRTRDEADLEWLISRRWFDRALFRRIVKKHLGNFAAGELPELFQVVDWKAGEGKL